jgi:hypothetical protein
LGCGMAGEKNDRIFFFLCFLLPGNMRMGPDLQYVFYSTANLFLNCWSKISLFLLTVPVM